MPIKVFVDASIGKTMAGAGVVIDLGPGSLAPIELSIPLGKIDSPNEAEVLAIHRAADMFVSLIALINHGRALSDEYVVIQCDSSAAVKAIQLCEQIKPKPLRVLAKKARKAWDSVRISVQNGPGYIAGWSIVKIDRTRNKAHDLATQAVAQSEDLYTWTKSNPSSGPSSSTGSTSRRKPRSS